MIRYKGIGLKLTPQRMAIMDYLQGNTGHPSAEEIFRVVSEKFPTMSLATVYNTLSTLREKGSVVELTIDGARKRYDPNSMPHHHAICTACKRILDVPADFEVSLPGHILVEFKVTGSHIEYYGLCNHCNEIQNERRI